MKKYKVDTQTGLEIVKQINNNSDKIVIVSIIDGIEKKTKVKYSVNANNVISTSKGNIKDATVYEFSEKTKLVNFNLE